MMKQFLIIGFFGFIAAQNLNAQVSGIRYQLDFDAATKIHCMSIVVEEGQTNSILETVQGNTNITFKIPGDSKMRIVKNYAPFIHDNSPAKWSISVSVHKPEADKTCSYVSVTPTLSPTAMYKSLKKGDKIRLFDFMVTDLQNCGKEVMFYQNGVDLDSHAKGLRGGDFSNGFVLSYGEDVYKGADPTQIINQSKILDLKKSGQASKLTVQPQISDEAQDLEYNWTGPNGFTYKGVQLVNNGTMVSGNYSLTIKNSIGCVDSKTTYLDFGKEGVINIAEANNVLAANNSKIERPNITEAVDIFPNPTTSLLNIKYDDQIGTKVAIDIVNGNGQVVIPHVFNGEMTTSSINEVVPVSQLTPGVYGVKIVKDENISLHKFIVVR